jgi:ribosome maturation factor RimP
LGLFENPETKEMSELLRRFEKVVEGVLENDVYELVDVEEAGAGRIFRVFVDKPGGVSVEDCARLSERLSERLDIEDFIPHRYTLEVSSPGLDRPLKRESDYQRFAGRLVRLTTEPAIGGQNVHTGRLVGLAAGMVKIEEGPGQFLSVPFSQIKRARLEIE